MKSKKVKILCIIMLSILLFVYLAITINTLINGNKIGFFSLRGYIMSSDSQETGIYSGDFVIAKSIRIEDIKEDDNIIYKTDKDMIVKKVKKVNNNNRKVSLVVEEDSGFSNENNTYQIIGKVIGKSKGIGNFALFMQSPMGTMNILLITVCVAIIVVKINKNIKENTNLQNTNVGADNKTE